MINENFINDVNEISKLKGYKNNESMIEEYKKTKSIELRNKIVEQNLKLVIKIAKRYNNKNEDDLIQEGTIELMNSIEKFDLSKNLKFSTFAYKNIELTIRTYISEKNNNFYKPRYFIQLEKKLLKFQNDFLLKNERKPDVKEMLKFMNINETTLNLILQHQECVASLDFTWTGENQLLVDLIEDKSIGDIDNKLIKSEAEQNIIKYAEKVLNEKDQKIFKLRTGLNEKSKIYTLEEIAKILNCTKQNVSLRYIKIKKIMIERMY